MQIIEHFYENNKINVLIYNNDIWFPVSEVNNIFKLNERKLNNHLKSLPREWKSRTENHGRIICDAGVLSFILVSNQTYINKFRKYIMNDIIYPLREKYIKDEVVKQDKEEEKPKQNTEPAKPVVKQKVEIEDDEPIGLDLFGDDDW